jgi:ferritin-like metal-binding protein YciE
MKFLSANLQDLRQLYIAQLQKALDMENHVVEALPTMIKKSTDAELKRAFTNHLEESRGHVSKVTKILEACEASETQACKVIRALVAEAEDGIKDAGDDAVRDVTLIAAAQQVEHHEIAVYGTLRTWAGLLGEADQANTLEQILQEEKHADLLLTGLSGYINSTAENPVYANAR